MSHGADDRNLDAQLAAPTAGAEPAPGAPPAAAVRGGQADAGVRAVGVPLAAAPAGGQAGGGVQVAGVVLFLFIPLVLFLFVRHPSPVGVSLAAGVVLMLGHRFAARPYMMRAAASKCLWCNRLAAAARGSGEVLDLRAGARGGVVAARCCAGHGRHAARFLCFAGRVRWPLRIGIFVPLLALLVALGAAAVAGPAGAQPRWLALATAAFQLVVGLTVSFAAWGYLAAPAAGMAGGLEEDVAAAASGGPAASAARAGSAGSAGPVAAAAGAAAGGAAERAAAPRAAIVVPFPLHNFFLLGVQPLLWIFRIVGAWWIWRGASSLPW